MQQFRPPNGSLFYSPQRDLLHLYPNMIRLAAGYSEDGVVPEIEEVKEAMGVTDEQSAAVFGVLCRFLQAVRTSPNNDPKEVLESIGWFKTDMAARACVEALLGRIFLATLYSSLRETPASADAVQALEATIKFLEGKLSSDEFLRPSKKSVRHRLRLRWRTFWRRGVKRFLKLG